MRKIIATTFATLDGVVQAPGAPKEDSSGGFAYGGWSVNYWDKIMGDVMTTFMGLPFELLLGKRTYDIFAAYWPHTKEDQVVAKQFNSTKKYVVSHEPAELTWQNSALITDDAVAHIKKLKAEDGPDLWVHGSGTLVQTLSNIISSIGCTSGYSQSQWVGASGSSRKARRPKGSNSPVPKFQQQE